MRVTALFQQLLEFRPFVLKPYFHLKKSEIALLEFKVAVFIVKKKYYQYYIYLREVN